MQAVSINNQSYRVIIAQYELIQNQIMIFKINTTNLLSIKIKLDSTIKEDALILKLVENQAKLLGDILI